MKLNNLFLFFGIIGALTGCGGSQSSPPQPAIPTLSLPNGSVLTPISGNNVLTMTVNGSLCAANSYSNKPCVSVTICSPNNGNCQTINDILVDTGSFGLRVFKSVLNSNINLTTVSSGSGTLAECVQYGDGSSTWGPVETAKVVLGGEPSVNVPVQVINSAFSNSSAYCNGAYQNPNSAGYNGILGVGVFAQDCGDGCATSASNGMYFTCIGSTCSGAAAPLSDQVQNPVALLPHDNNGVIVELPSIPLGGVASVNGYLVLGIGTQSNNVPAGVTAYSADTTNGEFTTVFNGQTNSSSFLDTGSNALYFTAPSASVLPDCGSNESGFFCPASVQTFSATTTGSSGSPSINVPFQVGNAISLGNSSNSVFVELGGDGGGGVAGAFDWGLPFHLGRNVYVGLENTSSTLGTGPYWAY